MAEGREEGERREEKRRRAETRWERDDESFGFRVWMMGMTSRRRRQQQQQQQQSLLRRSFFFLLRLAVRKEGGEFSVDVDRGVHE
jgi:hypothetical protein